MIFNNNISNELKWECVRGFRNRLLSESDWTQLSDSPLEKNLWANYRTELRNIPQNFATPEDVIWPSRP